MLRMSGLMASVLALFCGPVFAADAALPRATPESQGVQSAGVLAFVEAANAKVNTMHSVMVLRNGQVIAEGWWQPQTPETAHVCWSLSKSFASTAVGLAIAEGKLSLDDQVFKFFPEDVPAEPSANLKAMRVRDLLSMSTGHENEPSLRESKEWRKTFFAHPVPHKPGTHFRYNSAATYMCSAIVQKVTGQVLVDYLQPRLFDPLGIPAPKWETSPHGESIGGWGLYLRTEDIAKFGQLFLQKGVWNGKQIVPAEWIAQATARQTSNGSNPDSDWEQGYGYQFWRCRHGAYRGDGKDGQFCIVIPELNVVVAMTAETRDMQAQLRLVWDHLLPAIRSGQLTDNPTDLARLKEKLSHLKVVASQP
jgi:CubicO group peptidase (beta-lactamase class C family)